MNKFGLHEFEFRNETAVYSPRWVEILSASWLCIILVAGTLLNGLIVFVFARNKHLLTVNNIYVLDMAIHNLGLSCLATEMPLIAEICGHWFYLLTRNACVFEAFLVYFVGLASMFVLVAMALSRYVAITRPFLAAKMSTRHSVFVVVLCEVLALCFAVPPLFGWGSYGLEAHGTSCGLEWRDTSVSFLSYLITITVMCLALPLVAMIYCYTMIYLSVKQAGANCTSGTVHTHTARARKERLLLKLSISFVLSFLISWTPYTIVSFYVAYGKPDNIDPLLSRSAALVAKSQVLWNPILYLGITDKFRKSAFELFKCRKRNTTVTELETVPTHFTNDRTGIQPTMVIRRTIQRIFTIARPSGVSTYQNGRTPTRRLSNLSQKNKIFQIRSEIRTMTSGIQQISDICSMDEDKDNTVGIEEDAACSSKSTEVPETLNRLSSSVIESSKEAIEASSVEYVDIVECLPTKQTVKRSVFNKSLENRTSTETLQATVNRNSPRMLRIEKNNSCGDVELHIYKEPGKRDNAGIESLVMSKNYEVVINVINDNNELIPID